METPTLITNPNPTLQEIRTAVRTSDASDWYQLPVGPTYLHQLGEYPEGERHREHEALYVNRRCVPLTIAVGLRRSERHPVPNSVFPDPNVYDFWVDVLWNGAPIDRMTMTDVDGGHGAIPASRKPTAWEGALAALVYDLIYDVPNDRTEIWQQASIEVQPGDD